MATNTYVALSTYTVTGSNLLGTTGVTFTGIPSGYTDLILVQNVSLTAPAIGCIRVGNGSVDTGSNYSQTSLSGNGSSASSSRNSNATAFTTVLAHMTSGWGVYRSNFQNYSNTSVNKTVLQRYDNVPYGATEAIVGLWRSTSAINTIQVYLDRAESYLVGSTFSLYGIAAASVGAKATGGTIYQDASYFYHVFSGNGTFTPTQSISADVLVVAGGGGSSGGTSGVSWGPGGGAGEIKYFSSQSLTTTGYTCTVGAGGAGTVTNAANGSTGGTSTFAALSSSTGGQGGQAPLTGGNAGATYTGGSGSGSAAGGGAGFGTNGGAGSGTVGGSGGNGSSTYSSWGVATGIGQNISGTYYLAGGGGGGASTTGGTGGYGGGGTGTNGGADSATVGLANSGSGGGGSGVAYSKVGNGGSGVIIVRYAK